jgi:hypothetical protein
MEFIVRTQPTGWVRTIEHYKLISPLVLGPYHTVQASNDKGQLFVDQIVKERPAALLFVSRYVVMQQFGRRGAGTG